MFICTNYYCLQFKTHTFENSYDSDSVVYKEISAFETSLNISFSGKISS